LKAETSLNDPDPEGFAMDSVGPAFPPAMPLAAFLFEYLYRCGVSYSFGVPGDFALPTFAWLEKSKISGITMTHEPSAGFAADAYARINGIGLVCVTYCVGGLNVLNAIAGAYAEKSPVVVVSGAPGRKDREKDPLLHHKVKTFETQRRVYDEVTVASTVLLEEQRAASEIVRCIEAASKRVCGISDRFTSRCRMIWPSVKFRSREFRRQRPKHQTHTRSPPRSTKRSR
jgi:hypothetical protein